MSISPTTSVPETMNEPQSIDSVLEKLVEAVDPNAYKSKSIAEAKAAIEVMVREIIGEEPTWNRNMTHEESLEYQGQMSMYREQISAAKSLGFDMKVSTDG